MTRFPIGRTLVASLFLLTFHSGISAYAQLSNALPSQPVQATDPAVESLRKAAIRAYGVPHSDKAWQLTGSSHVHGANQKFELVFDSQAHFRISTLGPLPDISAFDGSTCWTSGFSAIPHRVILRDRDLNRLVFWAMTGAWPEQNGHITLVKPSVADGDIALTLKTEEGVVDSTLLLDRKTHLAKSLNYRTDSGDESWTFADYKRLAGRMLPTHIDHKSGTQSDKIEIQSVSTEADHSDSYVMPEAPATEFDSTVDNTVEIKSVAGLLFIHPLLDGKDVGWFFLDTGADVMCLDPKVIKQLHFPVVGSDTVAGAVGVAHYNYCQGATFQVGPFTIKKPVFLELDLDQIGKALHMKVVGVCGYDFIARTSLDIDLKARKMQIFKPGEVKLPDGANWQKICFDSNTPLLECRFAGDHTGYFSLDTGSMSTVDFLSPAVEKYHLMDHQDTTSAQTGGAGGTAESKLGKIDWFELGGKRIEQPTVGFQLAKTGAFSSPYHTGNIGMGFMGQYRCLFDYANERVAFIEPK